MGQEGDKQILNAYLANYWLFSYYIPNEYKAKIYKELEKQVKNKYNELHLEGEKFLANIRHKISELVKQIEKVEQIRKECIEKEKELEKELKSGKNREWAVKNLKVISKSEFKKSSEVAELGFALFEKNKGLKYKTKYGANYTLKFIGDYLPNYKKYLSMASTFGDVACLAQIHTLLTKKNNEKDMYKKVEIMMIIMSLYNPNMLKEYVESEWFIKDEQLEEIVNNLNLNLLREIVSNLNLDEPVDYKLDPALKLYYDSGFNAFYLVEGLRISKYVTYFENNICAYKSKYIYSHIKEGNLSIDLENDICVYRNKYTKDKRINHPLFDEFVSIIGLISTNGLSVEDISNNIGCLRIL